MWNLAAEKRSVEKPVLRNILDAIHNEIRFDRKALLLFNKEENCYDGKPNHVG